MLWKRRPIAARVDVGDLRQLLAHGRLGHGSGHLTIFGRLIPLAGRLLTRELLQWSQTGRINWPHGST
jgi:hypothetical protein